MVIFDGRAEKTPKYNDFILSLQCVEKALKSPESLDWLEEEVYYRNSYKSFQRSDKLADAIKIIYKGQIWKEISDKLKEDKKTLKEKLDSIIILRDDIAHQDTSTQKENISKENTIENINIIENIVETIHLIIFMK